tara:strand:+ start:2769 stop:2990 length:222 start_codon:yes stop_codon:yes gene_type:complete
VIHKQRFILPAPFGQIAESVLDSRWGQDAPFFAVGVVESTALRCPKAILPPQFCGGFWLRDLDQFGGLCVSDG